MDYISLEKIRIENKKKICIFGAGKIGRTWAYDILTCAGFAIDCYCDNKMRAGSEIVNGIKTVAFDLLCEKSDEYLIFITVNEKLQDEIVSQLEENGITDYIRMGFLFLQELCESVIATQDTEVWERYKMIANDEEFLKRQFKYFLGYDLDLENPQTFNAKLQWLKLHDRNPEYTRLVDKYEFKKYIAQVLGEEYVIPTLGVWDSVDEIEWDKLPNQFVIKCTHDSGSVIICKDKNKFDVDNACKILGKHLKRNFFWAAREWPYKNINPKIIAEEYLVDESGYELKDYKIFVFHGKVKFIQVDFNRFAEHKRNIYTTQWEYIDMSIKYPTESKRCIKRPSRLNRIIDLAEKIAKDLPHGRVDFYSIDDAVYFGELTLYHGAGFEKFTPAEWDLKLGELIDLSEQGFVS